MLKRFASYNLFNFDVRKKIIKERLLIFKLFKTLHFILMLKKIMWKKLWCKISFPGIRIYQDPPCTRFTFNLRKKNIKSICLFSNCLKLCILYIYQKNQHKKKYCINKLPGINLTNLSYILLHLITYSILMWEKIMKERFLIFKLFRTLYFIHMLKKICEKS
jgi:hypothetical protein